LVLLDVILIVLLIAVCLGAALLTVFQLPGTWTILAAAAAYGWYDGWLRIGWKTVAVLAGIALLAEATETLSALWFAKKGGASRRAAWWGLAGGLAGAFLLSIPVPIIGTVIGAAIGCFVGALAGELTLDRSAATGVKVGLYAALGRTLGTMVKIGAVVVMSGITIVSVLL